MRHVRVHTRTYNHIHPQPNHVRTHTNILTFLYVQGAYDIARLAVGGVIAAVDAVVQGQVDNAYCLVRPPGCV